MSKKTHIRRSLNDKIVNAFIILFFSLFTLLCIFPFYYLFINTISDNDLVAGGLVLLCIGLNILIKAFWHPLVSV